MTPAALRDHVTQLRQRVLGQRSSDVVALHPALREMCELLEQDVADQQRQELRASGAAHDTGMTTRQRRGRRDQGGMGLSTITRRRRLRRRSMGLDSARQERGKIVLSITGPAHMLKDPMTHRLTCMQMLRSIQEVTGTRCGVARQTQYIPCMQQWWSHVRAVHGSCQRTCMSSCSAWSNRWWSLTCT